MTDQRQPNAVGYSAIMSDQSFLELEGGEIPFSAMAAGC